MTTIWELFIIVCFKNIKFHSHWFVRVVSYLFSDMEFLPGKSFGAISLRSRAQHKRLKNLSWPQRTKNTGFRIRHLLRACYSFPSPSLCTLVRIMSTIPNIVYFVLENVMLWRKDLWGLQHFRCWSWLSI